MIPAPWNSSLLDTNWGTVRYGILVLGVGLFIGVSAFFVAQDARTDPNLAQERGEIRNGGAAPASPILLERAR